MAEPTLGQVFIEQALQDAAVGYRNSRFIAQLVAPRVRAPKDSGKIFVFDKAAWFRDGADVDRAPGTRAPRDGYTVSTLSYALNEMAQAHPIPDRIAQTSDSVIRNYTRGVDFCLDRINLRLERHAAAAIHVTGVWGTDNTSATDWDDFSNGDPALDILTAKRTVEVAIGRVPNTLVVGRIVDDSLRIHPDGLDRFKHTRTGIMTDEEIAQWLGIERYIVGTASRNTADEGATASMSPIWDDDALVCYVPTAPSLDEPAACYTLTQGEMEQGIETKRYREEAEAQDVVEAMMRAQVLVTASDAGYFFSDIV